MRPTTNTIYAAAALRVIITVFVIIDPSSPTSKSTSNLYVSPAASKPYTVFVSPRKFSLKTSKKKKKKCQTTNKILTFHVQLNLFPLQTSAVARRASVLSFVAHVHFLYVQTSVSEYLEAGIVQIVHSRVPVPLDGRLGIAFGRTVQHHRIPLDRLRRILRLDGELRRDCNKQQARDRNARDEPDREGSHLLTTSMLIV